MSGKNFSRDLLADWERGVQRAAETHVASEQTANGFLDDAAGLHVNSGVRGGSLWSATCYHTCASCDCTNVC